MFFFLININYFSECFAAATLYTFFVHAMLTGEREEYTYNDSKASVTTAALTEAAGDCLSAVIVRTQNTQ